MSQPTDQDLESILLHGPNQNQVGKQALVAQLKALRDTVAQGSFAASGDQARQRTISEKLSEYVSVDDFDVDLSGATNSTAGFRQALAAAKASTEKLLFIPEGILLVDATVTSDSNYDQLASLQQEGVTIAGCGYKSVIKMDPNSVTSNGGTWTILSYSGNTALKNLRFDGSRPELADRFGVQDGNGGFRGMLLRGAAPGQENILWEDIWIHDVFSGGKQRESFAYQPRAGTRNMVTVRVRIHDVDGSGFNLTGIDPLNNRWSSGFRVIDCETWNCHWSGLTAYFTEDIIISNSIFRDGSFKNHWVGAAGLNFEGARNVKVYGGEITRNRNGVAVGGPCSVQMYNVKIHNNAFNTAVDGILPFRNAEVALVSYQVTKDGITWAGGVELFEMHNCEVTPGPNGFEYEFAAFGITDPTEATPNFDHIGIIPRKVVLNCPHAHRWRHRIGRRTETTPSYSNDRSFSNVSYPQARIIEQVNISPVADWTALGNQIAGTAYSGTGNTRTNAVSLTATAPPESDATFRSPIVFVPGNHYLMRWRIKAEDDNAGWVIKVGRENSNNALVQAQIAMPNATADVGIWFEGEYPFELRPDAETDYVMRVQAATVKTEMTSVMSVDYIEVYRLLP